MASGDGAGGARGGDTPLEVLVARVRGEYGEMPGLRVTLAQACRLWQVDVSTCGMLLDRLVREGFLHRTNNGFYIANDHHPQTNVGG
jgi:hypothetical protein